MDFDDKIEIFVAEKGMNFESIYYHFIFMYHNEQYLDCIRFVNLNKWWFSKMKESAKEQVRTCYLDAVKKYTGGKDATKTN